MTLQRARGLAVALLAAALAVPPPVWALETADEIEDCIRENLPSRSSVLSVLFRARDRGGSKKDSEATIYWKKGENDLSRVMIRVSGPPKLRGTGVLMLEKSENATDRFLYLPSLRKVRRITQSTSSGSFLGTDFTYDDLERMHRLDSNRESRRLPDGAVSDRPAYILETLPGEGDEWEYERSLSYVDQESCVVLKAEFFEKGDRLRKVLTADPQKIQETKGLQVPHLLRMDDLREESSTDLIVQKIDVDAQIQEKVFSRKELAVGRR